MRAGLSKNLQTCILGQDWWIFYRLGNGYCNKNVSMKIFQLTVKKKEAGKLMQFKTYIVFSKSSVISSFPATTPFCT